MLLCPNCASKLKKSLKHGEGVWLCSDDMCGMVWFILDIPTPKHLKEKGKK